MSDPTSTRAITGRQRAPAATAAPTLVVVSAGAQRALEFPLDGPQRTVGRGAGSDLLLDDPTVSRRHAVFRRAGSAVLVEDAGSTAGVHVNGQRIDGPALLRPGDVVTLGRIELQLRPEAVSPGTLRSPGPPPPTPTGSASGGAPADGTGPRFDVGSQHAGSISNIAGDQMIRNEYALRFAPLRRRARILIRLGTAVVFGGLALSLVGAVRYLSVFREWMDLIFTGEPSPEQAGEVFSRFLSSAFPFFIGGAALIVAGIACIVTGLLIRRHTKEATR